MNEIIPTEQIHTELWQSGKDDGQPKEIPLLASDWKYKNEGGENIILSYCGKDASLRGTVLRLKKKTNKQHESVFKSLEFHEHYLKRVIDVKYLALGIPVKLQDDFIDQLNKYIAPVRPEHRKKNEIEKLSFGLLLPDLTWFPIDEIPSECFPNGYANVYTIEIKPKWGSLPTSRYIRSENACKYATSRYQMHQHLKMKDGSISKISQYCPLDLFSGDQSRIEKAIKNLLDEPQNNLKIYCNEELLFTGALGGKNKECSDLPLVRDRLSVFMPVKDANSADPLDVLAHLLSRIFTIESLLGSLKKLQELDTLDIEGVYYLQQRLEILRNNVETTNDLEKLVKNHEELDLYTEGQTQSAIDEHLIAATAKDCSVMVTLFPFQWNQESDVPVPPYYSVISIPHCTFKYFYRVTVVDIDPKSHENIKSWYKQDQEIVRLFSETLNNKV